jgi:hypothetical protein
MKPENNDRPLQRAEEIWDILQPGEVTLNDDQNALPNGQEDSCRSVKTAANTFPKGPSSN